MRLQVLAQNVHLQDARKRKSYGPVRSSVSRKIWQTLSSIKTGVVLIILVVILSAAGTVILQRPITDPDDMQRAYSPAMLRFLDVMGLTDIFHTRWFVALMILVSLSIIAASVQRFPNAWRYFARPYKSPDEASARLSDASADSDCGRRAGIERGRTRLPPPGIEDRAHRSHRQLLAVFGTQPDFRDGSLHRSCQPAADFSRRHHGRSLGWRGF